MQFKNETPLAYETQIWTVHTCTRLVIFISLAFVQITQPGFGHAMAILNTPNLQHTLLNEPKVNLSLRVTLTKLPYLLDFA